MKMLNPFCYPRNVVTSSPRLVVIGGAGGIGRALVTAAVALGHNVVVLDLQRSLDSYAFEGVDATIAVDATDPNQLRAGFDKIGELWSGIDGLVVLPGLLRQRKHVEEFTLAEWTEVLAVSLTSTFLSVQAAHPLLRKGARPSIVTMSSGLGVQSARGYGPYSAAKAGVISLTRTLALELAPLIRVNSLAPGLIETAFQRGGAGQPGVSETSPYTARPDPQAYAPPLGRIATPDDLIGTFLFLLGPSSALLTGQVLHVNGGALML